MGILKSHSAKPVSETLFANKIQPLLKSKCLGCHGEGPNNKIKGDLDMRSLIFDKSTPALIMGAISAGVPAIYVPSGPMIKGNWRGQVLGSGSDV